jgi:hypothetical protein
MDDLDLDRRLSEEEPLTPSSGFSARVMEAVDADRAQPAPLPFPWWRFLAGAVASGVAAVAGAFVLRDLPGAALTAPVIEVIPHLALAAAVVFVSLFPIYGRRLFSRE